MLPFLFKIYLKLHCVGRIKTQGSKGIRQWPKNYCISPMMKIYSSVNLILWLECLNTHLNQSTNQNPLNSPKLSTERMRKRYK